ncbi:MAG TPA: choice-of-anchor tandem repeat GloVer-containing protein [Terriglobia bacterium]
MRKIKGRFGVTALMGMLVVASTLSAQIASPAQSQSFVVLHSFGEIPDGADPNGVLIHDAEGNLYGTTGLGGTLGYGTVFRIDATGKERLVYYFTGASDGANPIGGLVQDKAGSLYGVAQNGGDYGYGTAFAVNDSGFAKVLHAFTGGADGGSPAAGLLRDSAGNLYGTTGGGGAFGYGTVFELDRAGTETVLHSFTDGADGNGPDATLAEDKMGNLYGVAIRGGDASCWLLPVAGLFSS